MLKEYVRLTEYSARRRDFVFSLEYDESGKRTLTATLVLHSPDHPPSYIKLAAGVLDSWGMDLTDWADNLEMLSDHGMTSVDGVSEK